MKLPTFSREHLLPLAVAIVSALGVVMLGMGQRDLRLALVALVAIAASFVLTDLKEWVRLNRIVANIAALAAVAASVRDFMRFDSDTQLLAIANLLIYLQIVLLFQEKSPRVYWQVLVLSLLEVVIGAALNLGALFGVFLVAYMFAMQVAVMLLYFRREAIETAAFARRSTSVRRNAVKGSAVKRNAIKGVAGRQSHNQKASLIADRTSHSPVWAVLREVASAALATLLVTAIVFFCVPRVGNSMWEPGSISLQPAVGFTGTVSLGALGASADNPEVVMRVDFRDENDPSQPYVLYNDPLFRGTILTRYSRGQWQFVGRGRARPYELPEKPPTADAVLQRITIEPLDQPVLFGVHPFFESQAAWSIKRVKYDPLRRQYVRTEQMQNRQFSFEALTTGIQQGVQQTITPDAPLDDERERTELLQLPHDRPDGALPIDELTELIATAERQVDLARLDRDDPYFAFNAARALELYLRSPPFRYSLEPQPRDRALDPVEDFIRNNPRGHCEYFASALALMLRSLGIPTRVAVGFKGGDLNSVGDFYQVRQLHAHAWVEAYLDPSQIPPSARPVGAQSESAAGWLTLDPTPASDDGSAFDRGGFLNTIANLGDYLKHLWSNYVVGLNAERQRAAIYQPLADFASNAEQFAGGQDGLVARAWRWLQANALSVRGMLILMAVVATVMVVGRWLTRIWVRLYRRRNRGRRIGRQRETVEFYERFEQILARYGLRRKWQQTPLELALAAGAEMVAATATRPDATLPRRIVEAYYRVRFGRHALDPREAELVEEQLGRLARVLERQRMNHQAPSD